MKKSEVAEFIAKNRIAGTDFLFRDVLTDCVFHALDYVEDGETDVYEAASNGIEDALIAYDDMWKVFRHYYYDPAEANWQNAMESFVDDVSDCVKGLCFSDLTESVEDGRDLLVEMARMNLDDDETSPLPMSKFDVRVKSNDHNPKHIHVTPNGGEEVRFRIPSGDIYEKDERKVKLAKKLEQTVKEWLAAHSATEPEKTNRQTCMLEWRRLHEGNN